MYVRFVKIRKQILLDWHDSIDRSLPWKETEDPYKIWLSEIILQQTRVEQGIPYYKHFIKTYPTVFDLANASEDRILKSWEGLGYYSRARNLHTAAKTIVSQYGGIFPNTYEKILTLKGIGPYTAAAIASFAFGIEKPVLDGNVFRVLARWFNEDADILSAGGKKIFTALAQLQFDTGDIKRYNQAIMDFGALVCTPKPACNHCPQQSFCESFIAKNVLERPVKKKARPKRHRHLHLFFIKSIDNQIGIIKRDDADIWKGLYSFPFIETDQRKPVDLREIKSFLNMKNIQIKETLFFKQTLSHQYVHGHFYLIETNATFNPTAVPFQISTLERLHTLAFPKLVRDFLDYLKTSNHTLFN